MPKSEEKYVVKVYNCSEVHLSEMTCYKIHTLGCQFMLKVMQSEKVGYNFEFQKIVLSSLTKLIIL